MTIARLLRWELLGMLVLGACSGPGPLTPPEGSPPPGAGTPVGPGTATHRTATLHEIVNEVQARPSGADSLSAAGEGDQINIGGQAKTGSDGKVRLDLTEGTIVRLAPNSEFTLTELSPSLQTPFAKLSLALGQVFVILKGGELEVEAPVGSATVRGSYLGVNYDPDRKRMVATCLEGSCELKNDQGTTPLGTGQAAEIAGEGQPPSAPRPIAPEEYEQWTTESPEARQLMLEGTPGTPSAPSAPGAGGSPLPPGTAVSPGEHVNTQPLRYSLTNNCVFTAPDGTTKRIGWHWKFDGPVSVQVDIPAGETRSGELPPGRYTVTDWDDEGFNSGEHVIDSDFANVNVTHCVQP